MTKALIRRWDEHVRVVEVEGPTGSFLVDLVTEEYWPKEENRRTRPRSRWPGSIEKLRGKTSVNWKDLDAV